MKKTDQSIFIGKIFLAHIAYFLHVFLGKPELRLRSHPVQCWPKKELVCNVVFEWSLKKDTEELYISCIHTQGHNLLYDYRSHIKHRSLMVAVHFRWCYCLNAPEHNLNSLQNISVKILSHRSLLILQGTQATVHHTSL